MIPIIFKEKRTKLISKLFSIQRLPNKKYQKCICISSQIFSNTAVQIDVSFNMSASKSNIDVNV